MPAASHHSVLHSVFILSTDAGQRAQDDDEDHSLVYAYPPNAPTGTTGGFVKCFSSLIVTARGTLDSICGEKTRLVHLEHGGRRLLLASAHLESFLLVLAIQSVVPPASATSLALHLAESLLLLLGPCAEWGLRHGGPSAAVTVDPGKEDTRAILDQLFERVLSQLDTPSWGPRMAPWTSFESSCLHLALPPVLQSRLGTLLSEHGAQRTRAPFSFFRKHSCLMYRGLMLASDLQPHHAKQLWQLLWTLGLHQHSGGLPCQVLTRTVHLPPQLQLQLQPASSSSSAAAATTTAGVAAASASGGRVAAPSAALPAESGLTVSEQAIGGSLLVVASAMRLVVVVVLTAYDEEIEEELAGRLEGHSAAELLQRVHLGLGADLERVVEGSAIYSAAARALETPSIPPPPLGAPGPPFHSRSDSGAVGLPTRQAGAGGGSLLFRVITRNRSRSPQQPEGGVPRRWRGGGGEAVCVDGGLPSRSAHIPDSPLRSSAHTSQARGGPPPRCPPGLSTSLPPGQPITPTNSQRKIPNSAGITTTAAAAAAAYGVIEGGGAAPHADLVYHRGAAADAAAGNIRGTWPQPPPPPFPPSAGVASPFDGVMLVIAHDAPHGCVRFLGDLKLAITRGCAGGGEGGGPGSKGNSVAETALVAVWRSVAACRSRFVLHNMAVAAPPKHARLTMTLDQILQLSAARSNKLGGQRLGAADSSPWQYHPELASLAAVNTVTLKLPLPPGVVGLEEGGEEEGEAPYQQQLQQGPPVATTTQTPIKPSWLARISSSHRGSSSGGTAATTVATGGSSGGVAPPGDSISTSPAPTLFPGHIPEPSTPASSVLPVWNTVESISIPQGSQPGLGSSGSRRMGMVSSVVGGSFPLPCLPPPTSLYLTGLLLPDSREVYLVHSAEVDEGRLAEVIWESAAAAGGAQMAGGVSGGELWGTEE